MRFTITPLGGAGRPVTKIVDAIVRYLTLHTVEPTATGGPGPVSGEAGPARYYADGGEEPGRLTMSTPNGVRTRVSTLRER